MDDVSDDPVLDHLKRLTSAHGLSLHEINTKRCVLFDDRLVILFVTPNLVCGHPKRGLLEETLFVLEVRHDLTPQLIKNLRKRFGPGVGVGVCAQRFEGGDQLTMLCINRWHTDQERRWGFLQGARWRGFFAHFCFFDLYVAYFQ